MFNPAYLMLSRHSVYYFRWPVPLQFSTDCKRLYVKLSLETKERKEALYLARLLEYPISMHIKQGGLRYMDASEIKESVRSFCQNMLEVKKRNIRENGALSAKSLNYTRLHPHNMPSCKKRILRLMTV